jgi:hypothetical protein
MSQATQVVETCRIWVTGMKHPHCCGIHAYAHSIDHGGTIAQSNAAVDRIRFLFLYRDIRNAESYQHGWYRCPICRVDKASTYDAHFQIKRDDEGSWCGGCELHWIILDGRLVAEGEPGYKRENESERRERLEREAVRAREAAERCRLLFENQQKEDKEKGICRHSGGASYSIDGWLTCRKCGDPY